jgi:nitroreductase
MKEANNIYPINEFARKRWSPRAFLDKPVEPEKLRSLFEAARWAPSGGNQQPWHFILGIRPDETWQKIYATLTGRNTIWNVPVPVLVATVGRKNILNKDIQSPTFSYDVGQSVAHLSIEATNLGLYVHQMAGFVPEKIVEAFEIPKNYQPLTVFAIGYIGDPSSLREDMKKEELEPRVRKEFSDFIFTEKFGKTHPLF